MENQGNHTSEGLTAYLICAQAEGKSPKTVHWVTTSVTYFSDFPGAGQTFRRKKRSCCCRSRTKSTDIGLRNYALMLTFVDTYA